MTRLIYILSASHSGSTLLAMLLASHPEITTVGELKADHLGDLGRYRCSCGEMIGQCAFWRQVGDAMRKRGIDFDLARADTDFRRPGSRYADFLLQPLVRGWAAEAIRDAALALSPTWQKRYSEIGRRNKTLIEVISEQTGSGIIVDSSKIGIRLKYLLKINDFDIRVIRLIRDGRAVATTYTDPAVYADAGKAELRGGGSGGDRASEKKTMKDAAREWRRSNEEAEAVLAGLEPSKWIEVRYESLCTETEAVLQRLFKFVGASPMNAIENFRKKELHILGNGMRLDESNEISLDDRWKSVLTDRDMQFFEENAGKLNRKYGYE
jgi:hypothetical protein